MRTRRNATIRRVADDHCGEMEAQNHVAKTDAVFTHDVSKDELIRLLNSISVPWLWAQGRRQCQKTCWSSVKTLSTLLHLTHRLESSLSRRAPISLATKSGSSF
jgi:homoserine acetyltransferase